MGFPQAMPSLPPLPSSCPSGRLTLLRLQHWAPLSSSHLLEGPGGDGEGSDDSVSGTHGLPCGSDGKESACSAGDLGLIRGLGRSPGEGNGNPSSILAWKIPWTEEPGGLQSMGSQRIEYD